MECLHGVARCSGQSSRSRRRSRHKHCLFGWPRPAGMAGGKGAPPLLPSPALPSAVLISFCQLVTTTLRRQHLAPSLACFAVRACVSNERAEPPPRSSTFWSSDLRGAFSVCVSRCENPAKALRTERERERERTLIVSEESVLSCSCLACK